MRRQRPFGGFAGYTLRERRARESGHIITQFHSLRAFESGMLTVSQPHEENVLNRDKQTHATYTAASLPFWTVIASTIMQKACPVLPVIMSCRRLTLSMIQMGIIEVSKYSTALKPATSNEMSRGSPMDSKMTGA